MSDKPVCERSATGSDGSVYLLFWCPGCETHHGPTIAGRIAWTFNGDFVKPTLSPSILTRHYQMSEEGRAMLERHLERGEHLPEGERYPGRDIVCHSFVRDGKIEFLSDCTHALAGQTVALEPME